MIKFTVEDIDGFYKEFISIIENTFEGERKERLLEMYEFFGTRLLAPASGKAHFHLPVAGGYLRHVLNVISISEKMAKLYTHVGGDCSFTDEERIFAAMHHDLGKLGDLTEDYYIPETSQWHKDNQGSLFKLNPALTYMNVTDRTFWLLQHFGIKISTNEQFGIMLADGMFNKGKTSYFESFGEAFQIKNQIAYIIHWSDWMSTMMERDRWNASTENEKKEMKKKIDGIKNSLKDDSRVVKESTVFDNIGNDNLQVFKDLFEKE